jgi:hypothetical protein
MSFTPTGTNITMPSIGSGINPGPKGFEFSHNPIVSVTNNLFNGSIQTFVWSAGTNGLAVAPKEVSVAYAAMTTAEGQVAVVFLESLNGQVNYFYFPTAVCNLALNELTYDGVLNSSNPRPFRLKSASSKWSLQIGNIYSVAFEVREAMN